MNINDNDDGLRSKVFEGESSAVEQSPSAIDFNRQTLPSRLLVACLFWLLCLTLTAMGHRAYKAIVKLDRQISATRYQTNGVPLKWVGHGTVKDAHERFAESEKTSVDSSQLYVLPTSFFWLSGATCLTMLGALMAWSGRWIVNNGIQSLVGLLAGHLLWLGAIELGLDAAGRRLGLAGSLEIVEGQVVGTHGAGILIQLSIVFLVPMLLGLSIHESNRCAMFQWFRQRLPITRTAASSGRVENYAARTAIQYFMTVWFCYVSVLWLADPRLGRTGEVALLVTMLGIVVATPYMIWRTACQSGNAQALRYSVSGAIVTWTGIEIAAAMNFFEEPWLSNSMSSGAILLALSLLLTALVGRALLPSGTRITRSPSHAALMLAVLITPTAGCTRSVPTEPLSAERIESQLREYDQRIERPKPPAYEGLFHALSSHDPEMQAQAAIAFSKSRRVSSAVKSQLEAMADEDNPRLTQLAALAALTRLDLLSPSHRKLLSELGEDPEWSSAVRSLEQ